MQDRQQERNSRPHGPGNRKGELLLSWQLDSLYFLLPMPLAS